MTASLAGRPHRPALGAPIVVPAAALVGVLVATSGGLRMATAVTTALALSVIAFRLRYAHWYYLVGWLVSLGLVRRLLSGISPKQAWGDPLILVGAAAWLALLAMATSRGGFRDRTRLTGAVLLLWILLAASALNPLQGGLTVGLGGLLLVVVPMSAFFVGRVLVDDVLLNRLLWLVASLGLVVAAYGLVQTFRGLPSWDQAWIRNEGYAALNVRGLTRAFASFSAASEYAHFLGLALVAWLAVARGVRRWPLVAGAVALLATALWYESARGVIVTTVVSVSFMLAARAGLGLGRSVLVGVAILASLPFVVGRLAPSQFSDGASGRLARHQVEGLSDPFGESSSLPLHLDMVKDGIAGGFAQPLGLGVGAVTTAADTHGGDPGSTEADPGNASVAAGLAGLLAYGAVILLGVPRAYRLAAARRDAVSLAALGFLVVTFLQWLNGGQYAVIFWPWLMLGWVDANNPSPHHARAAAPAVEATA